MQQKVLITVGHKNILLIMSDNKGIKTGSVYPIELYDNNHFYYISSFDGCQTQDISKARCFF